MTRRAGASRLFIAASTALVFAACGGDSSGSGLTPAAADRVAPTTPTILDNAPITDVMTALDLTVEPADTNDIAKQGAATTTTTTPPPPDTTSPETTTLETSTPEPTAPESTIAATPIAVCDHHDEWVVTASGRRVLLRSDGINAPAPTVLVVHGFTGTPTGIERVSNMTVDARGTGVAVAYPEGSPVAVGGLGWNSGASVFAAVDTLDIDALVEMVDALVATGCVDRARITISGESNGGGMTLAAICSPKLSATFQHAVMVVPAVDAGVLGRCNSEIWSTSALTVVAGLVDLTAPFDGGNGLLPQSVWFTDVAQRRGCDPIDAGVSLTDVVERFASPGCGVCTELLTVADGPHTWPGSPVGNGALVAGTFDLNRRIVADLLAGDTRCLSER